MDAMSVPAGEFAVPDRVRRLAAGAALTAVWRNGHGGVTFRTSDDRYVKHGPLNDETTMAEEVERLRWAAQFARVPEVLESGEDAGEEWLVTRAIPARSAVDARWVADPAAAVAAVGAGLRLLHDALPVADCPFDWQVAGRLERAARRGIAVPAALHDPPPVDRFVVCHGDACCPNTLLDDLGAPVAHVDLGALGVADRWADIAVAAMSTEWNYGPGWDGALLASYGVEPDEPRLAYYRDLWNAT